MSRSDFEASSELSTWFVKLFDRATADEAMGLNPPLDLWLVSIMDRGCHCDGEKAPP